MRLRIPAIAAVAALSYLAIEHRHELPAVPDPIELFMTARGEVPPFRFTLTTEPEAPACGAPMTLRVHVVNPNDQPVDGLLLEAGVSFSGSGRESRHVTLRRKGKGDYEGKLEVDMAGSWNVDVMATKDGETHRQRLNLEVGPARDDSTPERNDDDDS
jgi:hypothetical protein